MRRNGFSTLFAAAVLSAVACSGDSHRPEVRAALDRAQLSLRESVGVAMTDADASSADDGRLILGTAEVFSVAVNVRDRQKDVRVDFTGNVVSTVEAGRPGAACPGSIGLAAALAVAEEAAGGEAVQGIPDDDVDCAFETQVLVGDVLWEVKVASNGDVLEQELSDEFGGAGDDDD